MGTDDSAMDVAHLCLADTPAVRLRRDALGDGGEAGNGGAGQALGYRKAWINNHKSAWAGKDTPLEITLWFGGMEKNYFFSKYPVSD